MTLDPKLMQTFGKSWYGQNTMFSSYPSFPKSLLLSTGFETVSTPAMEVYNSFFAKLQDYLGATIGNFSIGAEWNSTSGISIPHTTYLNEVSLLGSVNIKNELHLIFFPIIDISYSCSVPPMECHRVSSFQ